MKRTELAQRLRDTAINMQDTSAYLEFFGGCSEAVLHAGELNGAADIVSSWAERIGEGGKAVKLTNKSIAVGCSERIEVLQEHVRRVNDAVHYIRSLDRRTEIDHGDIVNKLYEEEMVEWRKLAMWGLTLDDADRDRIKAAVHQRFLRDGMAVHDWMSDGVAAGYWLSSDEAEFRDMAKKAFGPKEES